MPQTDRHKVFISFYHDDQTYKDLFVRMMEDDIVDKSVEDGDIDDANLKTDTIRQKIRDDFIADATVTVVLAGPCTWQRKHVDWEIGSSLRDTEKNPRCGLLGILLPNHPNYSTMQRNPRLIPPRLADNCTGSNPYAVVYKWPAINHWSPAWQVEQAARAIRGWIHKAFQRRKGPSPTNSYPQFKRNRSGNCSAGWQE